MKSPMLGLRTVGYRVPDLQAAKAWYCKSFNATPYFEEPYYIGFSIGGYELGLMPDAYLPQSNRPNSVTYWGVEDIESEYNRLINLGAVSIDAPENVGGDIVVAVVSDPWGNLIGLIYNPDFKAE